MKCPKPKCGHPKSRVIDTEKVLDRVRRRRRCVACGHRWTTWEMHAELAEKALRVAWTVDVLREAVLALEACKPPERAAPKPCKPTRPRRPPPVDRAAFHNHRRDGIQAMLRASADAQRDGLDDGLDDEVLTKG